MKDLYKDSIICYEYLKDINVYLVYVDGSFIGDINKGKFSFYAKGLVEDYKVLADLSILVYRYLNQMLVGQENYTI